MSRATHPQTLTLAVGSVKTTAVLLAAVTLSCAAGVGASSASAAGAPTPTTLTRSSSTAASSSTVDTGGVAPSATDVVAPTAVTAGGTPRVPSRVPDAPARVRAVVTRFALSSSVWSTGATAPRIDLRIDARKTTAARVQVRVEDRRTGRIVLRQSFGTVRSGVEVRTAVTARLAARPGSYRLRLIVRDQTGHRAAARDRTLRVAAAAAKAPSPAPATKPPATTSAVAPTAGVPGVTYVFPVQGACNFRTLSSQRFHAARDAGRAHNGQDIGTGNAFPPVVAVTAATVDRVWYDDAGGGWTIVFDGDDGTAYGYLHLKAGSILVKAGDRVTAGQRVANAGNTGGDYEPHLHFEMRPIPWATNHDNAVDPLPLLESLPNPCVG